MPTYRVLDQDGVIVDNDKEPPNVSEEEVFKMYKDMLTDSKVSAGEEGIAIGSASALSPADVIFAQYRETGIFQHRGFTLDDFMNQLFANRKDPGRGRNMPVHYGSKSLKIHTISSPLATQIPQAAGAAYALKMQDRQNPLDAPR
ncbi:hypothetical protein LTR60_007717, partial [Cryomyces antarcticus]